MNTHIMPDPASNTVKMESSTYESGCIQNFQSFQGLSVIKKAAILFNVKTELNLENFDARKNIVQSVFFNEICENVIDDLMLNDALGILLSQKHFNAYLNHHLLDGRVAGISENFNGFTEVCARTSSELQLILLVKYAGLRIKESTLSKENLHSKLDEVTYRMGIAAINMNDFQSLFDDLSASDEIENSWKYRRIVCA